MTRIALNKANVAPIYTQLLNNNSDVNALELRELIMQQREKAEEDKMELLNKNSIKPFKWAESSFQNITHIGLPDKWAFEPFSPNWSW